MAKKNYVYGEKAVKVMEWLNKDPDTTDKQIAKWVGCHPSYVTNLRKKMVHAQQEQKAEKLTEAKAAEEAKAKEVDTILDARANQYGSFMQSADTAIKIKGIMHNAIARNEIHMFPDQLLALDMIAVKISRIVNGNAAHRDSWIDIAGYAKLVADRLEGKVR